MSTLPKSCYLRLTTIVSATVFFVVNSCTNTFSMDFPTVTSVKTSLPVEIESLSQTELENQPTLTPPSLPAIWIAPEVPEDIKRQMVLLPGFRLTNKADDAQLKLEIGSDSIASTWIYALVAPFPTILDNVTSQQLISVWKGEPFDSNLPVERLLVSRETKSVFDKAWGPASKHVSVFPSEQILDQAWKDKSSWAIIPFQDIESRWKVLEIDGISPLRKGFDVKKYALRIEFSLHGPEHLVQKILGSGLILRSNRDEHKLTTVILTGVTALVRGTASMMEVKGLTYPAIDIRDWLREADITHISNEIPFTPKCPPPYPRENNLVFCSAPKYIELLRDVGTDVVELTGDHFQDWGPEAMLFTIDLYRQEGWQFYGGGVNLEEARKPLLIEHNGNKIAFLGCNAKGPGYAGARENQPGAALCDFAWMRQEIKKLRDEGYLPVVTFQHLEYYSYTAHPILQKDFRAMTEAGAVIVSGSQAHQPHAFEFVNQSLLHYGLGNLFFDQVFEGIPTRQAFIDRHVFYNGRYIGTELLTIYFVDLARPRPMTVEERQDLLQTVFTASGW